MKAKLQDIETRFEEILEIVGSDSYVNWETFTKSSTQLTRSIDSLSEILALLKQIQQKRFINVMKKLKGSDVPDLIKTVKGKKLPKEALKTILDKFTINEQGNLLLVGTVDSLKEESKTTFDQYVNLNEVLTKKMKDTRQLISEKIKESGLYQQPAPPKELVSTFKHHFSAQKIEQVKKGIVIQYLPGNSDLINIQTYGQIVQQTYQVVKDQYKRLTLEARYKQRKSMSDSKLYVTAIIEYLTNTQVLILQGQKAIVKVLGLQNKKVEESQIVMMERGLAQTILLIQSGLRTRVKESILPTKEVDFDKTKEIIKFQVAEVKEKSAFFKGMIGSLQKTAQNFQIIPLLIALTLNDLVYLRYGVQQQDFMKSVTDQMLLSSPEVSAVFKQMQIAIIHLMRDAGVITEDMAKVIEMQSQQIQNQVNNMNQNSSGLFPGSNPLQILQMQQMQQFEQMQKNSKN